MSKSGLFSAQAHRLLAQIELTPLEFYPKKFINFDDASDAILAASSVAQILVYTVWRKLLDTLLIVGDVDRLENGSLPLKQHLNRSAKLLTQKERFKVDDWDWRVFTDPVSAQQLREPDRHIEERLKMYLNDAKYADARLIDQVEKRNGVRLSVQEFNFKENINQVFEDVKNVNNAETPMIPATPVTPESTENNETHLHTESNPFGKLFGVKKVNSTPTSTASPLVHSALLAQKTIGVDQKRCKAQINFRDSGSKANHRPPVLKSQQIDGAIFAEKEEASSSEDSKASPKKPNLIIEPKTKSPTDLSSEVQKNLDVPSDASDSPAPEVNGQGQEASEVQQLPRNIFAKKPEDTSELIRRNSVPRKKSESFSAPLKKELGEIRLSSGIDCPENENSQPGLKTDPCLKNESRSDSLIISSQDFEMMNKFREEKEAGAEDESEAFKRSSSDSDARESIENHEEESQPPLMHQNSAPASVGTELPAVTLKALPAKVPGVPGLSSRFKTSVRGAGSTSPRSLPGKTPNSAWEDLGREKSTDRLERSSSSTVRRGSEEAERGRKSPHFVFLVHGLEGSPNDLRNTLSFLSILLPEHWFYLSESNQANTYDSIANMGKKLADEVLAIMRFRFDHITHPELFDPTSKDPNLSPVRISFIGHSLGGLIIRAALPHLRRFHSSLHAFITLGSPHLGCTGTKFLVSAGLKLLSYFQSYNSVREMALEDSDGYLLKLSEAGLGEFKTIGLLGVVGDGYVPFESALVLNNFNNGKKDSAKVMSYRLFGQRKVTHTVMKIGVLIPGVEKGWDTLIGRQAHVEVLLNTQLIALIWIHFHKLLIVK